ncbi:MAG: ABC transporter permease [Cytophagales bacterium]|nr:ABC transporter permease [Cytophagales bacterium]
MRGPAFIEWLLERFCDPRLLEGIQGDLEEKLHENAARKGQFRAKLLYSFQALGFMRLKFLRKNSKSNLYMVNHYFTSAVRSMKKQRVFSAIHIFGLATSMTLCLLMILFYLDQQGMDRHNEHYESSYRILTTNNERDRERKLATTPYDIAERLAGNFDNIEATSRYKSVASDIRLSDKTIGFSGLYAEPNFFSFFGYELNSGNPASALNNPGSVVLTQELSEKLFGQQDPIGQLIEIGDMGSFQISGITKPLEGRSHLLFDALISISSDQPEKAWTDRSAYYNYFRMPQGNEKAINNYLSSLRPLLPSEIQGTHNFELQKMSDINFGPPVRYELGFVTPNIVLWFLVILVSVIMLSACFNYIGLSIAQSLKRAKEIGIRKIMGAGKKTVIFQFLIEAQVTVLISWVFAIALLAIVLPIFNDLKVLRDIQGQIDISVWSNASLLLYFLGFAIFIGLIAGGYPSWYVGKVAFQQALKRTGKKAPGMALRKSLVLIQYIASVIFIITAIVVSRQSTHFFEMEYGFEKESLASIEIKDAPYEALRNELLKQSNITSVSLSSSLPALEVVPRTEVSLTENSEPKKVSNFAVNEDFLDNFSISLTLGENFRKSNNSDQKLAMINEAMAKELDISEEHQLPMTLKSENGPIKIIGVVEDFKYQFLFIESGPLLLTYEPESFEYLNIKYANLENHEAEAIIEASWREFDKIHPFEISHYAYEIDDIYAEFEDIAKIVGLVAALAIIIACIGQFGMILHHVELKTKEVGVRKVLGSGVSQLVMLLSRSFYGLIVISLLIGGPIAWFMNNAWTSKLGYSINVDWTIMTLGILLVIVLASVSILWLTVKAANTNPVKTLRYE